MHGWLEQSKYIPQELLVFCGLVKKLLLKSNSSVLLTFCRNAVRWGLGLELGYEDVRF